MAQFKGKFNANGSYNVNSKGPFDARNLVDHLSDLANNSTFGYNAFPGMIVSVANDGDNNGVYVIKSVNDDTGALTYEKLVEGNVDLTDYYTKSEVEGLVSNVAPQWSAIK